jgi:two-component system OmpR family response regulator
VREDTWAGSIAQPDPHLNAWCAAVAAVSIIGGVKAPRIGVCEDDRHLRSVLERALRREGFDVRLAASGREAVELFSESPPDVLVLDIGLPDADGRDVCQALRVNSVDAPVIFLTARDALTDRLSGFHVGADDYVTKPFAVAELVARIRVAARRRGDPVPSGTEGLEVDPVTHSLRKGERSVELTPTEFRLLAALAARPGSVVRRRALREAGWPEGAIVHANTLDAYIVRLRRKLGEVAPGGEAIQTVRGVGYVLR